MSNIIYYVDSPCGSGKTFSSLTYLKERKLDGTNYILSFPTIKLASEVYKNNLNSLSKKGYKVKIINGGNSVNSVVNRIVNLCNNDPKNIILLITHEAFRKLTEDSFFFDKFEFIQDEKLTPIDFYELYIPKSIQIIKEFISIESFNSTWSRLIISNKKLFDEFINNPISDQSENIIRKLLLDIENGFIITKVDNWNNLINGVISEAVKNQEGFYYDYYTKSKINEKNKLYFIDLFSPIKYLKFKKATIMSAFLNENSTIFNIWKKFFNVEFKENTAISKNLRINNLNNRKIYITYKEDRKRYSKSYGESEAYLSNGKPVSNSSELLEIDRQYFNNHLKQDFIYFANKSTPDCNSGIRLSGNPYGINTYSDINCISITSHVMFKPVFIEGLKFLGLEDISIEELDRDNYYQAAYRTSIRDVNSEEDVYINVPSIEKAIQLAERIPGALIGKLEYKIEEKIIKITEKNIARYFSYSEFNVKKWISLNEATKKFEFIQKDQIKEAKVLKKNYQKDYRESTKFDKYYREKGGIKFPFPVINYSDDSLLLPIDFTIYDSNRKFLESKKVKAYDIFSFMKAISLAEDVKGEKFYYSYGNYFSYITLKFDKNRKFEEIISLLKKEKIYNITHFSKEKDCYISFIPVGKFSNSYQYNCTISSLKEKLNCNNFHLNERFSLPSFEEKINIYYPRIEKDFIKNLSKIHRN